MDSSVYGQHSQQAFGSPVYMQQVYSPQQQYPVYPLVTPSWNPSVAPYFETPLVSYLLMLLLVLDDVMYIFLMVLCSLPTCPNVPL